MYLIIIPVIRSYSLPLSIVTMLLLIEFLQCPGIHFRVICRREYLPTKTCVIRWDSVWKRIQTCLMMDLDLRHWPKVSESLWKIIGKVDWAVHIFKGVIVAWHGDGWAEVSLTYAGDGRNVELVAQQCRLRTFLFCHAEGVHPSVIIASPPTHWHHSYSARWKLTLIATSWLSLTDGDTGEVRHGRLQHK